MPQDNERADEKPTKENSPGWPDRAWRGRVDVDQSVYSKDLAKSELHVIRHARLTPGAGWSNPSQVDNGFIVTSCLRPTFLEEVQADGKTVATSVSVPETGLLIYSQKSSYAVHIPEAFDAVSFRVSQAALDEKARDLGHSKAPDLCETFLSQPDDVLFHLSKALLPALEDPSGTSMLFADHIFNAVVTHLVQQTSGLKPRLPRTGGLAPWQERRAMDLLRSDFRQDISLAEVAAALGLSTGHFARAFRTSVGLAPHQWRLQQRIKYAMTLLEKQPALEISEIAMACGFADQSHFTRLFRRLAGTTPAVWRRQRR